MKQKLRVIAIPLMIIAMILSSCGLIKNKSTTIEPGELTTPEISIASPSPDTQPTPEPTPDFLGVYREKLDYFYDILSNGIEDWDYGKGEVGLMEIATYNSPPEALASAGYTIQDLSGDGIPELLIINVNEPGSYPAKGSSILALFSSSNGTPILTFEGWSRNLYAYYDQDIIYNSGSNGATHHVYIINKLSHDGKSLECLNYYITQPKENEPQTEGYFQDPECGQGQHLYEELDLNRASFMQLLKEQLGNPVEFELIPFSDYKPSLGTSKTSEPVVNIEWAEAALANFSSYDSFNADESEYRVELLISSDLPLRNFNFLRLSIEGADESGNLITTTESIYNINSLLPDRPLLVRMTFFGDLPSYGISFEDENGETRSFYIGLSGYDGSLELIEFNAP